MRKTLTANGAKIVEFMEGLGFSGEATKEEIVAGTGLNARGIASSLNTLVKNEYLRKTIYGAYVLLTDETVEAQKKVMAEKEAQEKKEKAEKEAQRAQEQAELMAKYPEEVYTLMAIVRDQDDNQETKDAIVKLITQYNINLFGDVLDGRLFFKLHRIYGRV